MIKQNGYDLNVEITHLNNTLDKHLVSIRKLKMAKLRPSQIGELPVNLQDIMEEEKDPLL